MPMKPKRLEVHVDSNAGDVETTRKLMHSAAWSRLRKEVLAREPLCRSCLADGKCVQATDVDHIVPHRGDVERFFDVGNLQPLCKSCHSRKTAKEDGGFGR